MRALVMSTLIATLASSACSDETGILVKTSTASNFSGSIDSLIYHVGADMDFEVNGTEFFSDEAPSVEALDVGRDLKASPHKLMIRPPKDAASGARYAIGVWAYSGDQRVGVGYIETPVGFISGSIVQWEIEIQNIADDASDGCISWALDDERGINIGAVDDMDCDGYVAGSEDCADDDPTRHMGAAESCGDDIDFNCDGVISGIRVADGSAVAEEADGLDNNCDGVCDGPELDDSNVLDSDRDGFTSFGRYGVCSQGGPSDCDTSSKRVRPGAWDFCDMAMEDTNCNLDVNEAVPCFRRETEGGLRCLQGTRECLDLGTNAQCNASDIYDAAVSFDLGCSTREDCEDQQNPVACVFEVFRTMIAETANCKAYVSPTSGICDTGGGVVDLPSTFLSNNGSCTYQILGGQAQQGYDVSLVHEESAVEGQVINACQGVSLRVNTTPASGGPTTIAVGYSQYQGESKILKVVMQTRPTSDCADVPSDELPCDPWVVVDSN